MLLNAVPHAQYCIYNHCIFDHAISQDASTDITIQFAVVPLGG